MSQVKSKFDLIPKPLVKTIQNLSNRYNQIVKQYKSLAYYGRPLFEDVEEIATIVWLNERMNIGLNQLAYWIGVTKETLYNMLKKLETRHKITIYDRQSNRVVSLPMTKEELLRIIDEKLEARSRAKISDPLQSSIVREFLNSKIEKRAKIQGHGIYLSEQHKKETIRAVKFVMEYIANNLPHLPTNPDLWTKEVLLEVIDHMDKNKAISPQKRYRLLVSLRRIPEFEQWLKGKVGAVTKTINPVMRVLFYKQFIRLKQYYMEKEPHNINELLLVFLHITTGAREGWSVCRSDKIKDCPSSLLGIKVGDISRVGDYIIAKIYESKTNKEWSCDLTWLDEELAYKLYDTIAYKDPNKHVVEVLTGISSVKQFEKYYRKLLRKISKILNLGFILKPHDLRRSHISILADLGVPLELAVSGKMDFGVGWEDLKTAVIFYLRFSKYVKETIRKQIETRKQEIIKRELK